MSHTRGRSPGLRILSCFLCAVLALPGHLLAGGPRQQLPLDIRIIPVEGEADLTIQIQEISLGPLSGAQVTFMLQGAERFPDGTTSATVSTDLDGFAVVRGYPPPRNRIKVDVRATYQGRTVTGMIDFGGKPKGKGGSGKWLVILGAAGAAAAAGALALGRGNSTTTTPTTPTTTPPPLGPIAIRPGSPTVGAP